MGFLTRTSILKGKMISTVVTRTAILKGKVKSTKNAASLLFDDVEKRTIGVWSKYSSSLSTGGSFAVTFFFAYRSDQDSKIMAKGQLFTHLCLYQGLKKESLEEANDFVLSYGTEKLKQALNLTPKPTPKPTPRPVFIRHSNYNILGRLIFMFMRRFSTLLSEVSKKIEKGNNNPEL